MISLDIGRLAEIVGGTVELPADVDAASVVITGAATVDSRSVEAGGLFVAIDGERVDGHDYAQAAVATGAAAVLGTRRTEVPTVVVADPIAALGLLAGHVLRQLPGLMVLAMTGSQGKTGTKDYLAAVLSRVAPTVATAGNYNNEIGVPLTVLRAGPTDRFLVLEMGARGLGHLSYLCEVAPPRIAAVLNVGTAHLGEFGSQQAIAQAKGEIIEALPADGVAVLSTDDPMVAAMGGRTGARVVWFGPTHEAGGRDQPDVSWRELRFDALRRPTFELGYEGDWLEVTLQLVGDHQVANAGAAAAMALAAGLDLDSVAAGLSSAQPASRWRMEVNERADGLVVINDAYNANPESMRSALQTATAMAAGPDQPGRGRPRRCVAVLGAMLELGGEEEAQHLALGEYAAAHGVGLLITVGALGEQIAEGARRWPGWTGEAIITASRDEALSVVRQNVTADDVVVVKASRGAALEYVAQGLLEA